MLGGAATHFAMAASFFDQVRPVGPVGGDFADADLALLRTRVTSTEDVERVASLTADETHARIPRPRP